MVVPCTTSGSVEAEKASEQMASSCAATIFLFHYQLLACTPPSDGPDDGRKLLPPSLSEQHTQTGTGRTTAGARIHPLSIRIIRALSNQPST
jgi:hypothetical protein